MQTFISTANCIRRQGLQLQHCLVPTYLSRRTASAFVSLNVNIAVDTTVLWTTVRAYNIILVRLHILPWELQIILHLHPALLRVSRGSAYCLNRVFYCTVSNFPGATLLLNNLQPRSAVEWRPGLHIWDTGTLTGVTVSLGRGRVACLNCCFYYNVLSTFATPPNLSQLLKSANTKVLLF